MPRVVPIVFTLALAACVKISPEVKQTFEPPRPGEHSNFALRPGPYPSIVIPPSPLDAGAGSDAASVDAGGAGAAALAPVAPVTTGTDAGGAPTGPAPSGAAVGAGDAGRDSGAR